MAITGEEKKVYQRELMRKRRAEAKTEETAMAMEELKPAEATEAEWAYCLKRAELAREYAARFLGHVRPSEEVCQSPLWQWENEVKNRRVAV